MRPLTNPSFQKLLRGLEDRVSRLERRYFPPKGEYELFLFANREALDGNLPDEAIVVSAGDEKGIFTVPPGLDETKLVLAEAGLSLVGGADLHVTMFNLTQAIDMLVAPGIEIASGDFNSFPPSATVIDTDNDLVQQGDRIAFNVDDDGSGAEGLRIIFRFEA